MKDSAAGSVLAPLPEQLAQWHALVERVRQGDEAGFVPWDEIALELGL
jgi:hypothetical protein